jgi:hypothetical protein
VEKMKEKAFLISLVIILALSAIIAPSSADHLITNSAGDVYCDSGNTIWKYTVIDDSDLEDISNWVVFWCNPEAILDVQVGTSSIPECVKYESGDWCWEYTYGNSGNPQQGIKIEYKGEEDFPEEDLNVVITLNGCGYTQSDQVAYTIKYNGYTQAGVLNGPLAAVCTEIPEFSTIALPVASILGLLFLFNHRKRRKEE